MTALKWIAGIVVGLIWCAVLFVVAWWFTFPSQAVVDRVAFEVQKGSNGTYALQAGSASPWWAGLSMADVMLMSIDKDGKAAPVIRADSVSARTSVFSLLGGGLPVNAVIALGDSEIVVDAQLDRSENPPKLQKIDAEAPKLSVATIGSLLRPYGANMSGEGDVEVMVDLEIADKVKDHDGRVRIEGKDLTVDLTFPDPISGGDFTLEDMEVSELELVLDVKDGKALLKRGRIVSDRATLDVDLSVDLKDKLDRSRMSGTMVMSDLGGELAALEPAFSSAKWDDEKYHYRINCAFNRMSASCVKPDRQRRSAPSRTPNPLAETGGPSPMPTPSVRTPPSRADRPANAAARRPSSGRDARDDRDPRDDEELLDDDEMEDDEELEDDDREIVPPVRLDVVPPIEPPVVGPAGIEDLIER